MKNSITEEIKLRHKIVLYALKCGNNAKAARKYHTSRQQEISLVKRCYKRYGRDGLAEVYVQCQNVAIHAVIQVYRKSSDYIVKKQLERRRTYISKVTSNRMS